MAMAARGVVTPQREPSAPIRRESVYLDRRAA
jgi:hypothetical protein